LRCCVCPKGQRCGSSPRVHRHLPRAPLRGHCATRAGLSYGLRGRPAPSATRQIPITSVPEAIRRSSFICRTTQRRRRLPSGHGARVEPPHARTTIAGRCCLRTRRRGTVPALECHVHASRMAFVVALRRDRTRGRHTQRPFSAGRTVLTRCRTSDNVRVIEVATVGHRRKLLQAITAAADCPEITAVSGRPATAPRASPRLGYGTPHRKRGRAASSKRVRHTRSNGLGSTASRSVWARNVPSNK
jgi:hypothetical protein